MATDSSSGLLGCDAALCSGRILALRRLPWWWRQNRHPKRRYPTTTPYGVRTQKTSTRILIAVKASNHANPFKSWVVTPCGEDGGSMDIRKVSIPLRHNPENLDLNLHRCQSLKSPMPTDHSHASSARSREGPAARKSCDMRPHCCALQIKRQMKNYRSGHTVTSKYYATIRVRGLRKVKCKKMSSACLYTTPWRHKASVGIAPRILNLGTRCTWVISFTPRPLYKDTHWIGGCVGHRAGLDAVARREREREREREKKIPSLLLTGTETRMLVTILCELSRFKD
jgi:hypothetical protein